LHSFQFQFQNDDLHIGKIPRYKHHLNHTSMSSCEISNVTPHFFHFVNLPIPHLGTLRRPGSLPGWTFVQLDFDINVYKCKCCKLRTNI
jgi:hypothetical protein